MTQGIEGGMGNIAHSHGNVPRPEGVTDAVWRSHVDQREAFGGPSNTAVASGGIAIAGSTTKD